MVEFLDTSRTEDLAYVVEVSSIVVNIIVRTMVLKIMPVSEIRLLLTKLLKIIVLIVIARAYCVDVL